MLLQNILKENSFLIDQYRMYVSPAQWLMPVIPATERVRQDDRLSSGVLGRSVRCEAGALTT
jgi:hypothetical protein